MKIQKRLILSLVIGIGAGIFVFVSAAVCGLDKKKKDELYRQIGLFSDTITIIQTDYMEEVVPKDLIYGALKGMLSALDAHSQFMDPQTYKELKVETEGRFGGIGIEITIKDGLLTVVTPLEDTPAWDAGIKSGDRIIKINDEVTRDMTLNDAVKKLRGKPGDSVKIIIFREAQKKILEFKLVRDTIKVKDIKEAKILEDNVGYIRLVEFRENTPADLEVALENLKKQGMDALILDLRNNPGGLLEAAVKITEKFIEKDKLIVYTKGRRATQNNLEFISHTSHPLVDIPMVVLINEGSASGSEILAGCLKDYKRAIILGVKSFGKGSVQTVIPLSDGSALRLSTAKYFTPYGQEIHGKGVTPDIIIEEGSIELTGSKKLSEEKTEDIFKEVEEKKEDKKTSEALKDYKADNQLMRAVDVLKALKIYQRK